MQNYDTIFHITLKIEALKFQKYKRSNIAEKICKYFEVNEVHFKIKKQEKKENKIKEIAIFPVSTSIVRSLPYNLIDQIITNFQGKYNFKIFIDNSDFSKTSHKKKF